MNPDMVYDVPWLHPAVPAHAEPSGQTVLEGCPFCSQQHRHNGFGHRLAHCIEPGGKGYLLVDAGPAPLQIMRGAMATTLGHANGAATSLAP